MDLVTFLISPASQAGISENGQTGDLQALNQHLNLGRNCNLYRPCRCGNTPKRIWDHVLIRKAIRFFPANYAAVSHRATPFHLTAYSKDLNPRVAESKPFEFFNTFSLTLYLNVNQEIYICCFFVVVKYKK